jgi:nitroimidazol reductase NimA-like FMN-containing flavoprotein (pyridoxamine 5'-phosphate oxidase superfamily)
MKTVSKRNTRIKVPKATRPQIPGYGVPQSKKGLLPWQWAEDRLSKSRQYWIATTRPGGRPHVMVVWALWLDGMVYFSTGKESRKAKNLAKNPHCVISTENAAEAVIVEGTIDAESDVERIREFILRYEKKYKWKLGEMGQAMLRLEDPVFRLHPSVAFGLWEKKFSTSATRWIFS